MVKHKENIIRLICGIVSVACVWGLWEYVGRGENSLARVLPPPTTFIAEVAKSDFRIGLGSQSVTIHDSVISSIYRVFAGLALGFVAALVVGFCISLSSWARRFAMPLVHLLAPVAPVAWIPVAIVLLGIGNQTAIFLVFMGVFFTLTIATIQAIDSVPEELCDVARTLGASPMKIWLHVIFPAILPSVFTILRLNFIAAWMAVLVAEMTGLRDGLGAIVTIGRNLFNNNLVMFGVCLIGVMGLAGDYLLKVVQRKFFWWGEK